jgi:hypothetical protein
MLSTHFLLLSIFPSNFNNQIDNYLFDQSWKRSWTGLQLIELNGNFQLKLSFFIAQQLTTGSELAFILSTTRGICNFGNRT